MSALSVYRVGVASFCEIKRQVDLVPQIKKKAGGSGRYPRWEGRAAISNKNEGVHDDKNSRKATLQLGHCRPIDHVVVRDAGPQHLLFRGRLNEAWRSWGALVLRARRLRQSWRGAWQAPGVRRAQCGSRSLAYGDETHEVGERETNLARTCERGETCDSGGFPEPVVTASGIGR